MPSLGLQLLGSPEGHFSDLDGHGALRTYSSERLQLNKFREDSQDRDGIEMNGLSTTINGMLKVVANDGKLLCVGQDGLIVNPKDFEMEESPSIYKARNLESGCKFIWKNILVNKMIGRGGQAMVYKVSLRSSNKFYALKQLKIDNTVTRELILQELCHILRNEHPNLVTSFTAYYCDGTLSVLQEYLNMGTLKSLSNKFGPIPLSVVKCVAQQALLGLSELHSHSIIHRDIKPSNLLLNSRGQVKISDFGVAVDLNSPSQQIITHPVGSHCYMSPERIRADYYGLPSDIWSLGLTFCQIALAVFPFIYLEVSNDPSPKRMSLCGIHSPDTSLINEQNIASINLTSPSPFRPSTLYASPSPMCNKRTSTMAALSPPYPALLNFGSPSPSPKRFSNASMCSNDHARDSSSSHYSSGISEDDNHPLRKEFTMFDFSILLQDTEIRIDFDKLLQMISAYNTEAPSIPLTTDFKEFIHECTNYYPEKRPSCSVLLQNPFVADCGDPAQVESIVKNWLIKNIPMPSTNDGYESQ